MLAIWLMRHADAYHLSENQMLASPSMISRWANVPLSGTLSSTGRHFNMSGSHFLFKPSIYSLPLTRHFSTPAKLTHTDSAGRATMVDVSPKPITHRTATAQGRVLLSPEAFALVQSNAIKKGDVLTVAQIAGINAAKQTGTLIPLCHPLPLSKIDVNLTLDQSNHAVNISATVSCNAQTGVEMEAIVGVSMAACTVYDMCKAVDRGIRIVDIRVVEKSGGRSGDWKAD